VRTADPEVVWLYELAVKPGGVDSFRALMAELVESARAQTGTLTYEWSLSADGRVAHVYERYEDAAATLAHLAGFRDRFAQRFRESADPTRLVVYGNPEEAVKEALAGLRPTFMTPLDGFDRRSVSTDAPRPAENRSER
jgi:quinol monooxygenase YgiN